jgi:hypothetical protein
MAKHKTVTHIPAAPPPVTAAPAPRLAVQLLTVLGEFIVVAACILGIVTAIGWLLAGIDRGRVARPAPLPPRDWVCWTDRRGEVCRTEEHRPYRRQYAGNSRD